MARSQIIKDLAYEKCDLGTVLKRTKVLIKLLGDDKILEWINCEIEGYKREEDIPEYRKLKGDFVGTYVIGTMGQYVKYSNVPIPLGEMPSEQRDIFLTASVQQGISTLQQILNDSAGSFVKKVPADIYRVIEKFIPSPFLSIVSGKVVYDKMQVMGIISHVENTLLDMLLLLEKEFGNLDDLDIDVDTKDDQQLDNIFHSLYVIIFNDNDNSVTIGNNNKLKDSTVAANIISE